MPRLTADEARSRTEPVVEDMLWQRRAWCIERIGACLLLVVLALTLAGLFSKGPLSAVRIASADGTLHLEYQRFLRNGAVSNLVVDARGDVGRPFSLHLDGGLLDGMIIESIQPGPLRSAAYRDGLRLDFQTDEQGRARVHFALRADGVGRFASRIGTGEQTLSLSQFIYP